MAEASSTPPNDPFDKASRFVENFHAEHSRFSPDTPSALHIEQDFAFPPAPTPAPDQTQTLSYPPPTPAPAPDHTRAPSYPFSRTSFGSSTFKGALSPPQKMRDLEEGYPDPASSRTLPTTYRDRLSRWFFDARTGGGRDTTQFDLPIQELPPWSPLNIKKHQPSPSENQCCMHCREHLKKQVAKKQKRPRRRILVVVLVILLLWLIGNVVALDIANFRSSVSTVSSASPSDDLSADQRACLSQFILNAPSTPTLYPCAQCLPLIEQVSSNSSSFGTALNAAQFCGLRSLWEDADATGQAALQASGWVEDVKFCAWGGVQCNGSGQVSSMCVLLVLFLVRMLNSLQRVDRTGYSCGYSFPAEQQQSSWSRNVPDHREHHDTKYAPFP
jgi:predicted nucleic acid-binding Zn ribbon protein